MKFFVHLAAAFAAVLLGGCMFAPGQHLSHSQFEEEPAADAIRFDLVPITTTLLRTQKTARRIEPVPRELVDYRPEPYRIGPGDVLFVTVWDHPDLTSPAGTEGTSDVRGRQVRPDGTMFYPYVGELRVGGLTVEELRSELTRRLIKFIDDPQVDVSIIRHAARKVTLSGAFEDTSEQVLTTTPSTLLQIVGRARIRKDEANVSELILRRDGREYVIDLDELDRTGFRAGSVYLRDGDHLHLAYSTSKRVFVTGEVPVPAVVPFGNNRLTLTEVLTRLGGLSQITSSAEAVYVIRGVHTLEQEPAQIFQLDARSPTSYVLADHFHMQARDVVFVGASGITRWNRFISQLIPTTTGVLQDLDWVDANIVRP
jgi:polysaccharide biosynthesis/export protein